MHPAQLHSIHPRITVCHRFDPTSKTDLFSTAITTAHGLFLIDPIDLPDAQLNQLAPVAGIIVTNANHLRAASELSDRFRVPIFAHERSWPGAKPARFSAVKAGDDVGGMNVIEIEGAVEGEIALYEGSDAGTLVLGDALINFEPYGFTFLPRKYCMNEKQMRRSLRQLLDKSAERMLFAHGTPIVSRAGDRLRSLLAGG